MAVYVERRTHCLVVRGVHPIDQIKDRCKDLDPFRHLQRASDIAFFVVRVGVKISFDPKSDCVGSQKAHIIDRVVECVTSNIQFELGWVESLKGIASFAPKGYVAIATDISLAERAVISTVSIAEPIPTTVREEFSFYMEKTEERRVQVLVGGFSDLDRRIFSLRYSDCTPELSNEALLQIATYAENEAMRLGIRLKDELTHTTRARGTLPAESDPPTEAGEN